MAEATTCSDFGAQEGKASHCFHCFPICHDVMGPYAMIFVFWMLSFKPAFSLSSFTFIKRLFSFSLLSAIRVVLTVLTVASWPEYRFLKRHVRWSGIPISWRIFHSLLWSTQSKALVWSIKQMFFWNSLAFSMIQWMFAIWSLVPLPFLNPAWTWLNLEVHGSLKT